MQYIYYLQQISIGFVRAINNHLIFNIQGLPKKKGDPIARQIAAKFGKFHFLKKWRSLFRKIATDRIAEAHPKNNGDHFGGGIVALFWCMRGNLFFQFKV